MSEEDYGLELLSTELKKGKNPASLISTYAAHVEALLALGEDKTNHEAMVIDDYLKVVTRMSIEASKTNDALTTKNATRTDIVRGTTGKCSWLEDDKLTIRPDELVIKPTAFNGVKPRPRKWLDDYLDAIRANGWSDAVAVKYFATYLTESAYAWFKTEVRETINEQTEFKDIIQLFNENYIGACEYSMLSKQLDKMQQKQGESISVFLPKIRELLLLMEPTLPEREQLRQIREKLRPEYHQWLAHDEPRNIKEFRACCLRVEAGLPLKEDETKDQTDNNRNPGRKIVPNKSKGTNKPTTETPTDEQRASSSKIEATDKSKLKCYECNRLGHIGRECRIRLRRLEIENKANADKVQLMAEPKTDDNEGNQVLTINHLHMVVAARGTPKLDLNPNQEIITIVKDNKTDRTNYPVSLMIGSSGKYIEKELKINNKLVSALVDTGAYYSAVHSKMVKDNAWVVDRPAPRLVGANGQPLSCQGTTELKLEMTIGQITKKVEHHAVIINELSCPILIGLQLMSKLGVIIDCSKQELRFKRTQPQTGIRSANDVEIPPRSVMTINANVNTEGTIIAAPNDGNNGILIANSISEVINGATNLLIANATQRSYKIKANTKLAAFETFEKPTKTSKNAIAMMMEIENFNELIQVGDDLNEKQMSQLRHVINKNAKAFATNDILGVTNKAQHRIELNPDAKPFAEPLRRRATSQVAEARKQIKDMLDKEIIEPSDSPWASAYVLVKKKNGEHRLCVDFRRLNAQTKKTAYPLPNVEECIERIAGRKFFSLFDFNSGFWQIEVEKESRELTAFRCEEGHFQFRRMPFGLVNAPASFQKMVNAVFAGLKGLDLQAFIDDVCLASDTWEEHISLIDQVLRIVIENKLTLKTSKCVLAAKRIKFLGHEISETGIRQDQNKLKALLMLEPPRDIPGVKRFLGMCSYYRKFVRNFSIIAHPLIKLMKKNATFNWGEEQQTAFATLLAELGKNATLKTFRHDAETCIKTDASKQGIAGMLLQKDNQLSDWQIVACCSRRLSASECNYSITDLEGLAVIYTLERFRHYLLGIKFKVLTDHCALCVLNQREPKSARLLRWAITLSEFDLTIEYTKGSLHADIDCLSRAPVEKDDDKYADKACYLITPVNAENWLTAYSDEESQKLLEMAKEGEGNLSLKNGVIYKNGKLYVPADRRYDIMKRAHASPVAGHGGIWNTSIRLSPYWWPNIDNDVKEKVKNCDICQRNKQPRVKPAGQMESFKIQSPGELVAIDCLGPLSTTIRGNKHVIVAIDGFSRFINARAVPDVKAATIADFFIDHCGKFGIPKEIITDNATSFKNSLIEALTKAFGVDHRWATAAHSQSNAIAERAIETFQEKMRIALAELAKTSSDWDLVVPVVNLSINTSFNKSIGCSPYELAFGRLHPPLSTDLEETSPHQSYLELAKRHLAKLRDNANTQQLREQASNKKQYDAAHRPIAFEVGDLVLIKAHGRAAKLDPKYIGPYEILDRDRDVYKLAKDPVKTGSPIINRHVSDLRAYNRQLEPELIQTEHKDDTYVNNEQNHINIIMPTQPRTTRGHAITSDYSLLWITALVFIWIWIISSARADDETPMKYIFNRANPLVWTRSEKKSIVGRSFYQFTFMMEEPCDRTRIIPSWSDDWDTYHKCENIFRDTFKQLTTEFPTNFKQPRYNSHAVQLKKREIEPDKTNTTATVTKKKRSIVGWIAAFFAYDFLKHQTVAWYNSEPQTTEALKVLHDRTNITEVMLSAATTAITKLSKEMTDFKERTPQLSMFISHVTTEFKLVADKIKRIGTWAKNGELDIRTIRELNGEGWPQDADPEGTTITDIQSSYKELSHAEIIVKFTADSLTPDTDVFVIEGISHYRNLTGEGPAEWVEYRGPSYAVYNHALNCARGFKPDFERKVKIDCGEKNYIDPALNNWVVTSSTRDPFKQPMPTKVIEGITTNTIYCFTRRITIGKETVDCPGNTFSVPNDVAFRTDDTSFIPRHDKLSVNITMNTTTTIPPKMGPPSATAQEGLEAMRKLFEIQDRFEKFREQQVLVTLPGGSNVDYEGAAKWMFGLSIVCASTWLGLAWLNEKRHGQHREKTKRQHKRIEAKLMKIHKALAKNAYLQITDSEGEEGRKGDKENDKYKPSFYSELARSLKSLANSAPERKHCETQSTPPNHDSAV